MKIIENYDLSKFNTFNVKAYAKFFAEIEKEEDLKELFLSDIFKNNNILFLGSGSNILFTKDFKGIVILNKLRGIKIIENKEDFVLLKSMGGEKWHDLVIFSINNGYWGMENLSFIPGTVGATPVQNIGAYGVEIKDILENVEAYNIENGEKKIFSNKECAFGYRESIFKNELKGKYFISSVVFKVNKKKSINIEYSALKEYIKENNILIKNPKDISDAITNIRKSKLPDPAIMGNAGSFFKNVYTDLKKIEEIKMNYPDVLFFEENKKMKIPAGWLIEKCGWKGKRVGNVGMHEKQALVLVNYGGATGKEIEDFSMKIIDSVRSKFGLILEREVNLI